MWQDVSARLAEQGFQSRIVPVQRLDELRQEIEDLYQQNLLDPELFQTYLSRFDARPDGLPEARSIFIVAVPSPQIRVTFTWNGQQVPAIIPPTYTERQTEKRVNDLLEQIFETAGYRFSGARLPKKLLAVRSGLAAYGRNNIAYVPGMGSFFGLVVAYSDLSATDHHWGTPQMLERCQTCHACLHHCPTGAISSDRFLIHAERCITYHNEKPSDVPFPDWVDPGWLNCLVGCTHCQRVCPENKPFWQWFEDGGTYSQEETDLLLKDVPLSELPASTADKLAQIEMDEYVGVVSRNLSALLHQDRLAAFGD